MYNLSGSLPVQRTLWHDHGVVGLYRVSVIVDHDLAGPDLEAEELIAVVVHFRPDLATGRDAHQHQLHVVSGVEHTPEVTVLLGHPFDVVVKAVHFALLD